jgi:hypothetical protein
MVAVFYLRVPIMPFILIQRIKNKPAVGPHQELDNLLCKKICKQLEIPFV